MGATVIVYGQPEELRVSAARLKRQFGAHTVLDQIDQGFRGPWQVEGCVILCTPDQLSLYWGHAKRYSLDEATRMADLDGPTLEGSEGRQYRYPGGLYSLTEVLNMAYLGDPAADGFTSISQLSASPNLDGAARVTQNADVLTEGSNLPGAADCRERWCCATLGDAAAESLRRFGQLSAPVPRGTDYWRDQAAKQCARADSAQSRAHEANKRACAWQIVAALALIAVVAVLVNLT